MPIESHSYNTESRIVSERLFIIIPAYNEQANISQVIEQWYPILAQADAGSQLVVIDDGSKDDTFRIIREAALRHPALIALTKPNQGHGPTVLHGYRYALDHGADFVFQTDSDGQTDPADFTRFWELRNGYDMVIGSRTSRQDGFSRIVVTKTLKAVVKQRLKVSLEDSNTPFRLMSARSLADCVRFVPEDCFLANVVLCAAYAKLGYSMRFLPITFKQRQGGTNSINLKSITAIGRKALGDFALINKKLDAEQMLRA